MKDNYVIIHGSFGSKDGNWFPWLKSKLEGKDVEVPQMPVGVGNQNFENWSKVLDGLNINENTTINACNVLFLMINLFFILLMCLS